MRPTDVLGRGPLHHRKVSHFSFGEHYTVHLDDGHGYAVPDLELMLTIVVEAFEVRPDCVPRLELRTRGSGIGQARQRELVVTPVRRHAGVPLDEVVQRIRRLVTYYNLSGSWDPFRRENL